MGDWAKMIKNIYPSSNILLFEANEHNESKLIEKNFPYKISLLGNEEKEVDFFAIKERPGVYNTGNSIFLKNTRHYTGNNYEIKKVKMRTLDEELKKYDIKNPDFIKMDVQGAEVLILKGAQESLKTTEFILLETQTLEYNQNAPMFTDVNNELENFGYQVFDIFGLYYLPNKTLMQLDVLYIKKDSKYLPKGKLS